MKNYIKITKRQAEKLFYKGETVFLQSSKMSWNNPWQNPCPIKFDKQDEESRKELHAKYPNDIFTKEPKKFISQFELITNEYRYYNCDKERGLGITYLIEN